MEGCWKGRRAVAILQGFTDLNCAFTAYFQIVFSKIFAPVSGVWNVFPLYTGNVGQK